MNIKTFKNYKTAFLKAQNHSRKLIQTYVSILKRKTRKRRSRLLTHLQSHHQLTQTKNLSQLLKRTVMMFLLDTVVINMMDNGLKKRNTKI